MRVREIKEVYDYNYGCTCPALGLLEDGRSAIIKYPQNPQGIVVLFNEFFAQSIAQAIDLTIPDFGIASVDSTFTLGRKSEELVGDCFFSAYIPKAVPISRGLAKMMSNLNETPRMILFDSIVKDTDRYNNNIICSLTKESSVMYMIDRSHALGDPDWDAVSLTIGDYESPYIWNENRELYEMLIRAGADLSQSALESEKDLIQSTIDEELLDSIISDVPPEWAEAIGQTNIAHAKAYVISKVNNLDKVCNLINRQKEGL